MGKTGKRSGKEVAETSLATIEQGGSAQEAPRASTPKPKKAKTGEVSKTQPTPAQRIKAMRKMTFEQTRWADHQILHDLGIFGQVRTLFANMGLVGLFHMDNVAYKEETYQFLASVQLYDDTSLDICDENRGRLSFTIHGRQHDITMAQIGVLFGFPTGGTVYSLSLDVNEAQSVWTTIANGEYKKGVSKASKLRHPAIRYAHKFLANTLFARRETGAVKEEELALLIEGFKPLLQTTASGETIIGQPKRVNFAHYLVRRFLYYQDWVLTHKDKTPLLNMGGLVTPILRACNVEIRNEDEPLPTLFMDAPYLATIGYLTGRTKKCYGYRFEIGNEKKIILLPNTSATSLETRGNIPFQPKLFYLYNPTRDGPLTAAPRKRQAILQDQEEEEEEEVPEKVMGSHRYDFDPYSEPITGEALRKAHEHIGLLQRFVKWQQKNIKKLTKTVKAQGKMIKKLLSPRGSPRRSTEEADMALALVLSTVEGGGEGTSRGREDKGKAPLSPSSSGSGNPSYSLDSSPDIYSP